MIAKIICLFVTILANNLILVWIFKRVVALYDEKVQTATKTINRLYDDIDILKNYIKYYKIGKDSKGDTP